MLALHSNVVGLVNTPLRAANTRASVRMDTSIGDITFDQLPWTTSEVSDREGMIELSKKLNPVVGFWGTRVAMISLLSPTGERHLTIRALARHAQIRSTSSATT